jgi:hypothetical protein
MAVYKQPGPYDAPRTTRRWRRSLVATQCNAGMGRACRYRIDR